MRRNPTSQPTFEELLSTVRDLPEGYRGQILDGVVVVSGPSSPARAHTLAELTAMFFAGLALGDPVPEAWSFLANVELSAGNDGLLTCDVAGWHLTRQGLAGAASPIRLTPEWVCEVLGASERRFSLSAKRRAFAQMGVEHLWLADPEARVLDVYRNQKGKWLLEQSLTDEENIVVAPFESLHFDARELWMTPVAPPPPSSRRLRV